MNTEVNHRLDNDLNKIRTHLESGAFLHAYQILLRYEELLMSDHRVLQLYAECLKHQERGTETLAIYKKYVDNNPGDISAILSLGKMYFHQKEWVAAAKTWKTLPLKKYPDLLYLIGYSLLKAGKLKNAARYLELYINKTAAPLAHPAAYYYLAKVYCMMSNFESALPLIEDLLDNFPDEPRIYRLAALIYFRNDMKEHGAEMVHLALQANPNPGKFIFVAVPVLLYSGRSAGALELINKFPEVLSGKNDEQKLRRGIWFADALLFQKKYAKSKNEFLRLLDLSPENPYIMKKLKLIEAKY